MSVCGTAVHQLISTVYSQYTAATALAKHLPIFTLHNTVVPYYLISRHERIIMVARSSVARRGYHYILRLFLFFSRHTFSDVGKPTAPKLSRTTWLCLQQNLCYTDFFKVPPKTNGAEKLKICTIFHAKSQTISAVVR